MGATAMPSGAPLAGRDDGKAASSKLRTAASTSRPCARRAHGPRRIAGQGQGLASGGKPGSSIQALRPSRPSARMYRD